MGMPDRNHGMAAIEVQVLLPFLVPHVRALGLYDSDVIDRINVE
jgi:hypothetical protein